MSEQTAPAAQDNPLASAAAACYPDSLEEGSPQPAVLLVDDEANVLSSLERLFRREAYTVFTARSGADGLAILGRERVALVISDQRMPQMDGSEFLRQVRHGFPETMRIMLTGYADITAATAAINEGEVYRFVTKPWDDQQLKLTVREALRHYHLVQENRRLFELTRLQNEQLRDLNQNLEQKVAERTQEIAQKNRELEKLYGLLGKNFFESIRVFLQLIEMYDPVLGGHCKRVAALASAVSARYGLSKAEQELTEVAGSLHDIGLIGLPREVLAKRVGEMSSAEAALFRQHPVLGYTALENIENLKQVGVLVKAHHENFDGTGYPDRLRGEEIPLGARIVRAASAYDDMTSRFGMGRPQALQYLERKGGSKFDPEVVFQLRSVLASLGSQRQEVVLPLSQLRPGMMLSRDLKTVSGRLLLPEKAVIQEAHIEKLQNFIKIDPIEGGIYVCKPGE